MKEGKKMQLFLGIDSYWVEFYKDFKLKSLEEKNLKRLL